MSVSIGSHIVRQDDGTWETRWAPFALKSAFQPIFAFGGGRLSIAAFEALLRPFRDGCPTSPVSFFSGLALSERITVENLLHKMHLLNAAACLPADTEIFINFDPSIFIDHAVVAAAIHEMRVMLPMAGIEPRRIVCEVTERETLSHETLLAMAAALKSSGFRIAVDDYGAKGSDMDRIRDLHPDIVKFDGEWVSRLMGSGPGLALLAAMVSTFAGQGIRTLFEGIEERDQIELAERAGVDLVQGFALAHPEIASVKPSEASSNAPDDTAMRGSSAAAPADHPDEGEIRHVKAFGRKVR